jgi:DNA-binding transcriptional MerR regulator
MESIESKYFENSHFKAEELSAIEAENPEGLSSGEIIEILTRRGVKFSEATLRKYVQLGLLPRSRRVGSKGKHKGSRGVYPAGIIRQINEIKRMMALDYTIEEIRHHFAFVGGEIEELRTLLDRILERLDEGLRSYDPDDLASTDLHRQIAMARETAINLVTRIENTAQRLKQLVQLSRDAV